jgi:hypothetical protein
VIEISNVEIPAVGLPNIQISTTEAPDPDEWGTSRWGHPHNAHGADGGDASVIGAGVSIAADGSDGGSAQTATYHWGNTDWGDTDEHFDRSDTKASDLQTQDAVTSGWSYEISIDGHMLSVRAR